MPLLLLETVHAEVPRSNGNHLERIARQAMVRLSGLVKYHVCRQLVMPCWKGDEEADWWEKRCHEQKSYVVPEKAEK